MAPLDSWGHSVSKSRLCFLKLKISKLDLFWPDLDLTFYLDSPEWFQIARRPSPLYSTWKIAHKRCATLLICVLSMVTFCDLNLTWSWPWPEFSVKHSLNQFLPLWFRSIWRRCWPKNAVFEVSARRSETWKTPILTFGLTLTWPETSFWKFRGRYKTVSSRAFERLVARLAAISRSRVRQGASDAPLPS